MTFTNAKYTLYHNPRCSKSRAARALLKERGIEPNIIECLKTPPTAEDIKSLIQALRIAPHELLRTKETAYTQANLTPESTLNEIANAIAQYPILMERPILQCGARAVIGRPTERLLDVLDSVAE